MLKSPRRKAPPTGHILLIKFLGMGSITRGGSRWPLCNLGPGKNPFKGGGGAPWQPFLTDLSRLENWGGSGGNINNPRGNLKTLRVCLLGPEEGDVYRGKGWSRGPGARRRQGTQYTLSREEQEKVEVHMRLVPE